MGKTAKELQLQQVEIIIDRMPILHVRLPNDMIIRKHDHVWDYVKNRWQKPSIYSNGPVYSSLFAIRHEKYITDRKELDMLIGKMAVKNIPDGYELLEDEPVDHDDLIWCPRRHQYTDKYSSNLIGVSAKGMYVVRKFVQAFEPELRLAQPGYGGW